METGNAAILRSLYEAFNRGELSRAREMLHPDAELHQPPEAPDTDSYHGRDEFERGFALWLSEWEKPRFEPDEVGVAGDWVIMRVRVSGTGRVSGVELTAEFFHAWTVCDGRPRRCYVRSTRAEALAMTAEGR